MTLIQFRPRLLLAVTMLCALPLAVPQSGYAADDDADSDEQLLLCIGVYTQANKRSSSEAARIARASLMTLLALKNDTTIKDPEIVERVKFAEGIVADMVKEGDSVKEMIDECNAAYELSVPYKG